MSLPLPAAAAGSFSRRPFSKNDCLATLHDSIVDRDLGAVEIASVLAQRVQTWSPKSGLRYRRETSIRRPGQDVLESGIRVFDRCAAASFNPADAPAPTAVTDHVIGSIAPFLLMHLGSLLEDTTLPTSRT
jgi:hypothetical protein